MNENNLALKIHFRYAECEHDGNRIVGVQCVYCKWEHTEKSWEVCELRLHQHMKEIHGLVIKGDTHVVR